MAYVEVDVDLDDFNTDELVDEVCRRLEKSVGKIKSLTPKQRVCLYQTVLPIIEALGHPGLSIKTLDEQMKYDHLLIVWDKYTSSQFETALNK